MEKHVPTRKEREDREEQTKYKFDSLSLEVKYPGTAVLLLQCQEKPVLLAAAAALDKFGSKARGNLEVLFDLEIVDSVIPLIEHDDLFTRRFAGKLLAEMAAIPSVRNYLLESNYYIPHFTKVLVNEADTFMQEFSSLILAELSRDMYGVAQLLKQCTNMNFLFERIQSPDPDVKKNNIDIIYNLIQDQLGATAVIESKDFNFSLIYDLFNSPYPEIQRLALSVISDLVTRNQDEYLQDLFRRSKGLQALLKFLDNDEWQDLHAEALRLLYLASDNPTTVEMLDDIGGIRQILKYIEDTSNSKLFLEAFNVAIRLSHTSAGRKFEAQLYNLLNFKESSNSVFISKALYHYGIVDYLLRTLRSTMKPDAYEITCHGIGMMTLYTPAAMELTAENCVRNILDLLKNESLKWSTRKAAMFALGELFKFDGKNCHNLLDIQGQNYLLWLIKQPIGKIPIEVQTGAVESLVTIARHPTLRDLIINVDVIDAMCASFEATCSSVNEFKMMCCNALSVFCIEKIGRDTFLRVQGPSRLYNLLSDVESIPIRNAAAQLVQLMCADPALSNAFIAAQYLPYMLNNRSSARVIPSWDTCIEALFDSHLPIKFAFTGRLSLHDVTQDGFYTLRRNVCPFPILDDVFRFKFSTLEPIYVVNCIQPRQSILRDDTNEMHFESKSITAGDDSSKEATLSTQEINASLALLFNRLQCDPYLYEYIELFKCKLVASEPKDTSIYTELGLVNIGYVALRAKMLAKFVARQMSGPDPSTRCMDHQLEVHLKEIKDSIGSSVIPLGMLRVGSYLERALLFKVIADRICLPAALVRGEYGKAWVEIAVPQVESPDEETSFDAYLKENRSLPGFITVNDCGQSYSIRNHSVNSIASSNRQEIIFPTKLMKPNFIVDLMNVPGDLIQIGSHRAELYCERQLVYNATCCN